MPVIRRTRNALATGNAVFNDHQQCPGGEWPTPRRDRIFSMWFDSGIKCKAEIGRRLAFEGKPMARETIRDIIRSEESRRSGKERQGRPCKVTKAQCMQVIRYIEGKYHNRRKPWLKIAHELHIDIKQGATLRRALEKHGYSKCVACQKPFISGRNARKRCDFAYKHLYDNFYTTLFTDECTFVTGKRNKDKIIRKQGQRYCLDCIQFKYHSGRSSFSIFAGVSWGTKTELVFLNCSGKRGGMNAEDYRKQVIEPTIVPALEEIEVFAGADCARLMEDGNSAHGLKNDMMRRYKESLGINTLDGWPPSSPDFNPIENIWRLLKQRIGIRQGLGPYLKVEQLKQALREEWETLTQDEIRKYISNMRERLQQAIDRDGYQTEF